MRDVTNNRGSIAVNDALEKRILQGRMPLPSESRLGIDVSQAAKANGIKIQCEITPACETLLMNVPEQWAGSQDYESRLYDLLYKAGEWMKNCKNGSDPAVVMSTERSTVFSLRLYMPNDITKPNVGYVFFLCELRRVAPEPVPEAFKITIGLDPRYHA